MILVISKMIHDKEGPKCYNVQVYDTVHCYSRGKRCISFHLIIGNSQHQVKAQWVVTISKGAFSFKFIFPHAMKETPNENKKDY